MDVKLPNGKIIRGVPEGTPKEQIQQKAISAGLATVEDFGAPASAVAEQPVAVAEAPAPVEQPQAPALKGNFINALVEPVQAIAGGAAREAVAGLAGIGGAIVPGDEGQGMAALQKVRETLPEFAPETEAGKAGLKTLGDLIQGGVDIVNFPISGLAGLATLIGGGGMESAAGAVKDVQDKGLGQTMGDAAFEATGSPALATAVSMGPDIAGAASGLVGAKFASSAAANKLKGIASKVRSKALVTPDGGVSKAFEKALKREGLTLDSVVDDIASLPDMADPRQAARELLRQKLARGDTDGVLATKRLNAAGQPVDDALGAAAIKQGFEPGDVQAIKAAKPGSRKAMDEMLSIRQAILNNTRKAVDVQPTDVIGRSAMARFDHIKTTADKARRELDSIASRSLAGKPIDVDGIEQTFRQQLANRDIKIDESTFPPRLDFAGSEIAKNRAAQRVIKDTMDLLSEDTAVDALRAHKLKRQLDEMIDYKKSGPGMLTPAGERVVKAVRKSLNDAVRAVDPDYARVNETLSNSLSAMNDFRDVLGKSIDPFAEGAAKAVGRDLRGLLSNRRTQTKLENAVRQLDLTAKDLGGNFSDDIGDLVNFNGILQSKFGSTKRQSFAGEIGDEVKRSARQAMQGKGGVVERGIDMAAEAVEKARNINDEEALKSIRRLIRNNQQ